MAGMEPGDGYRRSFLPSKRERHGDRSLQSGVRVQSQERAHLIPGVQSRDLEPEAKEDFQDYVSSSEGAGEGGPVPR